MCLDHHCFAQAAHRGCHLPWSLALVDLLGVALGLLLVLRDRVRRPALARVFQRQGTATVAAAAAAPHFDQVAGPVAGAEWYSVWVSDPPPDATDPDAWRDYFQRYGEVLRSRYSAAGIVGC